MGRLALDEGEGRPRVLLHVESSGLQPLTSVLSLRKRGDGGCGLITLASSRPAFYLEKRLRSDFL